MVQPVQLASSFEVSSSQTPQLSVVEEPPQSPAQSIEAFPPSHTPQSSNAEEPLHTPAQSTSDPLPSAQEQPSFADQHEPSSAVAPASKLQAVASVQPKVLLAVDVPAIVKISLRDQPGNSALGFRSKIDPFEESYILR